MSLLSTLMGLESRLNPVLVKEVRQSLRSKQFRAGFGFSLVIGLLTTIMIVLNDGGGSLVDPIGPDFFTGTFSCLTIAVIALVPMSAFTSMGAEFEEDTLEMLQLSHLKPRQIMLGKLLAAGVQALLFFSVFGFLTVFAFLFGGINLTLVLVCLPLLAVISLAYSALALGLSSLSAKRTVRVGMMVLLAGILIFSIVGLIGMAGEAVRSGIDFSLPEVRLMISAILIGAMVIGSVPLAIGVTRLAHPEENRSTGLRLLAFALILMVMGWSSWLFSTVGSYQVVLVMSLLSMLVVGLFGAFFATERETLGRRVELLLPRNPIVRLFCLPWLPGGGRGVLWIIGMLGLIVGCAYVQIPSSVVGTRGSLHLGSIGSEDVLWIFACMASYGLIYILLVAGLMPNWGKRPSRTVAARVAIPILFVAGIFIPMLIGFLFKFEETVFGQHLANPIYTFINLIDDLGETTSASWRLEWPLLIVAGIVLLIQVPRIWRGVNEVLRAGHGQGQA